MGHVFFLRIYEWSLVSAMYFGLMTKVENQRGRKRSTNTIIFWGFGWKEKVDFGPKLSVSLGWNWKAFTLISYLDNLETFFPHACKCNAYF